MSEPAAPPASVLVVVTRRMGDVLLATPLLRSLKAAWPQAALDVLVKEPGELSNPLFGLDNAIITPHASFYSEEAIAELEQKAADRVALALRGETPPNVVNPAVLERADYRLGKK